MAINTNSFCRVLRTRHRSKKKKLAGIAQLAALTNDDVNL
jgi:hypothetical protein